MRVLMWILDRCENKADAVKTPIGWEPRPEDINIEGLDINIETVKGLLEVDPALWRDEVKGIAEFYDKFGGNLPKALCAELNALEERLK